jgi:hypothetical protein
MSMSALSALGQASFVIALPVLSRLYTPSDFGLFTIYLSIVNIGGPIVGLKFESALYAARTKQEAGITLALSVLTITIMSGVPAVALFIFSRQLMGTLNPGAQWIAWYLPFGLLLAGMWSASSAWAVKSEAISTLRDRSPRSTRGDDWNAAGRRAHSADSGVILIGAHLITTLPIRPLSSENHHWSDTSVLVAIDEQSCCGTQKPVAFPSTCCPRRSAFSRSATFPRCFYRCSTALKSPDIVESRIGSSRRRSPLRRCLLAPFSRASSAGFRTARSSSRLRVGCFSPVYSL